VLAEDPRVERFDQALVEGQARESDRLPIDDRLRIVARGQFSRLAQYEIEVESPLRPKEIQDRIRAGETAEEIADAAGVPIERVRRFEGPVLAERAYKELSKRLRVVASGNGDPEPVHRARKAAKRARYATELATPVLAPRVAARTIRKTMAIQDVLGQFQDSVVAADTLLRMGIRAGGTPNENGFTYGLLYALEQRRAEVCRRTAVDKLR